MSSSNAEKSRPQGRPPKEDSADIRQQIMESAVDLFASQGYAATSVREIADRVGVNPAMIHYYFGSKEALLHAALEQLLEPLAEAVAAMQEKQEAPLQDIVSLILGAFARKPNLPVLMAREVLLPGGAVQAHFKEHFAPRLGGALPQLLQAEQRKGRLRGDLDPRLAAQTLFGLCVFPFISRGLAGPVLGISYDEKGIQKIGQNIIELLQRGFYP
jgi:TetR/AcrR family transcriptional regulator